MLLTGRKLAGLFALTGTLFYPAKAVWAWEKENENKLLEFSEKEENCRQQQDRIMARYFFSMVGNEREWVGRHIA